MEAQVTPESLLPWHWKVFLRRPFKYLKWRHEQNIRLNTAAPAGYGCPSCGSLWFYEGPHGGLSINVKCANAECGKKYNFCGPFPMIEIDNADMSYGGAKKTLWSME